MTIIVYYYILLLTNIFKGRSLLRVLPILLFLGLCAPAMAVDWYVGFGIGQTYSNNDITLDASDGVDSQSNKKTFGSKRANSYSFFIGQSQPIKSIGSNLLLETFYNHNSEKVSATEDGPIATPKTTMERSKTFGFNVGLSRPIMDNTEVFLKMGAVISQFNIRLQDTAAGQQHNGSEHPWAWGFAPSLGIQQDFGGIKLGLSYSYYMYQNFTAKVVNAARNGTYMSKINPRYHLIEVNVAKVF